MQQSTTGVSLSKPTMIPFAKISPARRNAFIEEIKPKPVKEGEIYVPQELEKDSVVAAIEKHFSPIAQIVVENPAGVGEIYKVPLPDGILILSHNQLQTFV